MKEDGSCDCGAPWTVKMHMKIGGKRKVAVSNRKYIK